MSREYALGDAARRAGGGDAGDAGDEPATFAVEIAARFTDDFVGAPFVGDPAGVTVGAFALGAAANN